MTTRNWKGKASTILAILIGTSLLMGGQAHAATQKSSTAQHKEQKQTNKQKQKKQKKNKKQKNANQAENTQKKFKQNVSNTQNKNKKQNTEKASAKKVSSRSDRANEIISHGLRYKGRPYKFGSSKNTTATFDCSSFTQRVFKEAGISLPRDSRQQSKVGKHISKSELKKGDLLFFRSAGSASPRITHVAIYAGNNTLLHTYGQPGVTTTKFRGTSWENRFILARRVLT